MVWFPSTYVAATALLTLLGSHSADSYSYVPHGDELLGVEIEWGTDTTSVPTTEAAGAPTTGAAAVSCLKTNVTYVDGPSIEGVTLENCQVACRNTSECKFFTWNNVTQGCGLRTYSIGGFLDAPGISSGTPYSSYIAADMIFVGGVFRSFTLEKCIQSCAEDPSCNSWSWYNANSGNSSLICVHSVDQAVSTITLSGPFTVFSGLKSCQNFAADCTGFVNNNTCCPNRSFVKNCGNDQTGTSGDIQSPNFPLNYNDNSYCKWKITGPAGSYISINIDSFNIEAFWDRLFIVQPETCSYVNESYLSGTELGSRSMVIPQNTVELYFYSDSSVNRRGFNITWESYYDCTAYVNSNKPRPFSPFVKNCGSDQTGTNGTIVSPNYFNSDDAYENCVWNINGTSGTSITLNVTLDMCPDPEEPYQLFLLSPLTCLPLSPTNRSIVRRSASGRSGRRSSYILAQIKALVFAVNSPPLTISWQTGCKECL